MFFLPVILLTYFFSFFIVDFYEVNLKRLETVFNPLKFSLEGIMAGLDNNIQDSRPWP